MGPLMAFSAQGDEVPGLVHLQSMLALAPAPDMVDVHRPGSAHAAGYELLLTISVVAIVVLNVALHLSALAGMPWGPGATR